MKNKFKIVNPSTKQHWLEYKLERKFISSINYFGSIRCMEKLSLPLRAVFPECGDSDIFQYQLRNNEEVDCYAVDLTLYNKGGYKHSPFSKAVLFHTFRFSRIN